MTDVSAPAAFLAGLVSFLSPCVLPLVPGYISYISGASLEDLREGKGGAGVVVRALFFVIGFSLVFVLLGASATWVGHFLLEKLSILTKIAGVIIIVFGLHLIGVFRIGFLYREKRIHSTGKPTSPLGAFVVGPAFAFGWTPCIGPVLAGIIAYAGTKDTVNEGVMLLSFYSLGIGLPFFLTALAVDKFFAFFDRIKSHFRKVEIVGGVFLVLMGLLIFTNNLTLLSSKLTIFEKLAM